MEPKDVSDEISEVLHAADDKAVDSPGIKILRVAPSLNIVGNMSKDKDSKDMTFEDEKHNSKAPRNIRRKELQAMRNPLPTPPHVPVASEDLARYGGTPVMRA
ncbi:hypothetical protein HBI56_132450 [Parastagonospora nodorum]|nr:hypothetical protein HBI09_035940 [Parastagonospora nodorum]KAH4209199.1 hypothetical protein HBI95_086850 [Parastagonospora nodorum]KAH4948862.1 hypothetical protein HBH74_032960 [Parastagonospora nodorum]KAH4983222.1 hypothetical protein HBH73_029260 [Parastagonospora nodorum]KAH4999492.1 hypothetical protein HBI77_174290 [Parastagonospora nodorum]